MELHRDSEIAKTDSLFWRDSLVASWSFSRTAHSDWSPWTRSRSRTERFLRLMGPPVKGLHTGSVSAAIVCSSRRLITTPIP